MTAKELIKLLEHAAELLEKDNERVRKELQQQREKPKNIK